MEVTNKLEALEALDSVRKYIETLDSKDISNAQIISLNVKFEMLYEEVQRINSAL